MKKIYSLLACLIVCIVLLNYRINFSDIRSPYPLKLTTWDALGYYMYLPGIFIYKDLKEINWLFENDEIYSLSGGKVYQAGKYKNGNYVFKYLGGVAILELPFFLIGHQIAKHTHYKADGFSPPYQYAIGFGNLLYFLLAIFLLRKILLLFFSDLTSALTIILVVLATNIIQYASIDNAQSHGPIFPLYVLVLYTTIKWHNKPEITWATITGFIIGLAMICRPTEGIMFLIPLLWNTHNRETAKGKWSMVKKYRKHIYFAVLGGFIGILPQLIYWKSVTGSFIYDVGSAWDFLTPHLKVLTGWNKGWFIYTPVTILFILGMFFMKKYPFKKAVIYFCLINIYIIISWRDWRYGGSYSTRALSQSYPVFSLALAAFIEYINLKKWRILFYAVGIYLVYVNIFQIKQYNSTILHYYDMNRRYYARIYLNKYPDALDMSLLDTKEWLHNEKRYNMEILVISDSIIQFDIPSYNSYYLWESTITPNTNKNIPDKLWLKVEAKIKIDTGFNGSYLHSELISKDSVKHNYIRLFNPISHKGYQNEYAFYVYVPAYFSNGIVRIYINSWQNVAGTIENFRIVRFEK